MSIDFSCPIPRDEIIERQAEFLAEAIRIIKAAHPTATLAAVSTSDQDVYGFRLRSITLADGTEVDADASGIADDVTIPLDYLNWNGIVNEGAHGDAVIDLDNGTTKPDC